MKLQSLIDQPDKLPTVAKVGQQLIASLSAEEVSLQDIANWLAADPVLSAKLLRLANSAYFQASRSIATVEAALQLVGLLMARNLVVGCSVSAAFKSVPGLDLKQFWRYNLYTACAARWLARRADVDSDVVFTLALIHAIGELHMHSVLPLEMQALNEKSHPLATGRAELEFQAFGFHFGDVSAELARLWNFPQTMVDALRHVAQPLGPPNFSQAAAWVHLGAWRARVEVLGLSEAAQRDSYPAELGRRLHQEPNWTPALAERRRHDAGLLMPTLPELSAGLEAMFE